MIYSPTQAKWKVLLSVANHLLHTCQSWLAGTRGRHRSGRAATNLGAAWILQEAWGYKKKGQNEIDANHAKIDGQKNSGRTYLEIGFTLASTTVRTLQFLMFSGNSWIPKSLVELVYFKHVQETNTKKDVNHAFDAHVWPKAYMCNHIELKTQQPVLVCWTYREWEKKVRGVESGRGIEGWRDMTGCNRLLACVHLSSQVFYRCWPKWQSIGNVNTGSGQWSLCAPTTHLQRLCTFSPLTRRNAESGGLHRGSRGGDIMTEQGGTSERDKERHMSADTFNSMQTDREKERPTQVVRVIPSCFVLCPQHSTECYLFGRRGGGYVK